MEIGIAIKTESGIFIFNDKDKVIGGALKSQGTYESEELNRISYLVDSDSKILWIGTHIGALMIPVAKKCHSIVGIEANPDTFELLNLNIKLNDVHNVTTFNVAAGENFGEIQFLKNTHNSGASKRKPIIQNGLYYYDNPEIINIPLRKMDDFIDNYDFNTLFMDIEGSEYFALKGMPNILDKVHTIFMEFIPFLIKDVAGVTAEQILFLLKDFETMVVPTQKRAVYKDEMLDTLNAMYENNIMELGLIFFREKRAVNF